MKILKLVIAALVLVIALAPCALAESDAQPAFSNYELETGISMRVASLGDEGAPAVLLIHGATDSYNSYAQLAPALAEAGYRVYVPELRGHGGTDKPDDGYYTLDQHVKDIGALIGQLGLTEIRALGHSLGSFVAQGLAAQKDAGFEVVALSLIGTAATTVGNPTLTYMLDGDEEFPGVQVFADGVPDEFIVDWTLTDNPDPAFLEATLEHARALPPYSWINTFYGLENADNRELLQNITCPVQLIWGSEDAFFSRDDQLMVIESLTESPNVDFVTIPGASHNTHWDAGALKPVTEAITGFFAE